MYPDVMASQGSIPIITGNLLDPTKKNLPDDSLTRRGPHKKKASDCSRVLQPSRVQHAGPHHGAQPVDAPAGSAPAEGVSHH